MKAKNEGHTQAVAGAKAGISERSGRRIEKGGVHAGKQVERRWRTREDPFAEVWDTELVAMLEKEPGLSATTLLEVLQARDPERYPDSKKRTLQRRVQLWKAAHGEGQAVIFRQEHPPGLQGLSDFTQLKGEPVTIGGKALKHLIYHFRLAFSGWCYAMVVLGGESFSALATGLQEALWRLGGSPKEHRTDSLSAAFKNLNRDEQKDVTERYQQLCGDYGMKATRNNRGVSHENGSIESPHGHLKWRIEQALLLRGSRDFDKIGDYRAFLDGVTGGINRRRHDRIKVERAALGALPRQRSADYMECVVSVTSASTMEVKRVLYSVPSRLVGARLRIHLYDDRLKAFMGSQAVLELPRRHRPKGSARARQIDYRHLIKALVRKPQAFRYSVLREDLLPNATYREIWRAVDDLLEPRAACKWMVGVLSLAARADCEQALGEYLQPRIKRDKVPAPCELQRRFGPDPQPLPRVQVQQHPLADYQTLLSSSAQVH